MSTRICEICQQEIPEPEASLSRRWHFDCEKCTYCQESMSGGLDRISECLTKKIPVSHTHCREISLRSDLRQKMGVTFEHIDLLNRDMNETKISMIFDDVATNSLDTLHKYLVDCQTLAANISWILTCVRDRVKVVKEVEFRHETAEKVKAERRVKADEEKRKQQLAAERSDPRIRDHRKSVEALTKLGITPELAEKMVTEQEQKGKPPIQ